MMEFTVDDFPTPPFPITIIVKEFTFYTKTNTRNSQSRKKKKKTSLQMQILAKKKDNSKTKLLSMKNCSRECNNLRGNKKNTSCLSFPKSSNNLVCVAGANVLIPDHSRITWVAIDKMFH